MSTRERFVAGTFDLAMALVLATAMAMAFVTAGCVGSGVNLATSTGSTSGSASGPGGPGNGAAVVDTSGPYGQVLDAVCDLIDRCPDLGFSIAYRSRAECIDILAFVFTCRPEAAGGDGLDGDLLRLVSSVPEVTAAQADACAGALATLSCAALGRSGSLADGLASSGGIDPDAVLACTAALVGRFDDEDDDSSVDLGTGAVGEHCERGGCGVGLYCSTGGYDAETFTETCAICQASPGEGDSCADPGSTCPDGLYCDRWDADSLCRPLGGHGAPCAFEVSCASNFCHPTRGTCEDGGHVGEACAADADCRHGAFCDPAGGLCAALRANGEPCADDLHCAIAACHLDSGRCGAPDGEPCPDGNGWDCASQRCDASTSTCAPPAAEGEPCERDEQCATGTCDFDSHTCIERCLEDADCAAAEFCDWDTSRCTQRAEDGAWCEDDEACASGWCNDDDQCATRPALGEPCAWSLDCAASAYCGGGVCTPRVAPGGACQAIDSCAAPFLCVQGRCTAPFLECRPAPLGRPCAYASICEEGGYCDPTTITCKARIGAGMSCLPGQCGAGLRCDLMSLTCAARAGIGKDCQRAGDCVEGLFCAGQGASRVCVAGPEGQPCDPWGGSASGPQCPEGLFCSEREEACQRPGTVSAECREDHECTAGLYCHWTDGCQEPGAAGVECGHDAPCADGLSCDDDTETCAPNAGVGEACVRSTSSTGIRCGDGLRCEWDGELSDEVCIPALAAGDPCDDDAECDSGACRYVTTAIDFLCMATAECVVP